MKILKYSFLFSVLSLIGCLLLSYFIYDHDGGFYRDQGLEELLLQGNIHVILVLNLVLSILYYYDKNQFHDTDYISEEESLDILDLTNKENIRLNISRNWLMLRRFISIFAILSPLFFLLVFYFETRLRFNMINVFVFIILCFIASVICSGVLAVYYHFKVLSIKRKNNFRL